MAALSRTGGRRANDFRAPVLSVARWKARREGPRRRGGRLRMIDQVAAMSHIWMMARANWSWRLKAAVLSGAWPLPEEEAKTLLGSV
jgi:hypothetical protein